MLLVTGACDRIANEYSPAVPPTLPAPAVVYITPAEPPTATAEADATQPPAANIAEASVILTSAGTLRVDMARSQSPFRSWCAALVSMTVL